MSNRRGLSLLEVALAFVILGVAVVPILNLFFGTNRLQARTASHFREAVAGQLVWESIKARNIINAHFLRDLVSVSGFEVRDVSHPHRPAMTVPGLLHTGAFVASEGPVDDQGRPLPVSPFATHLFNRSGGELYASENRFSLDSRGPNDAVTAEEIASLTRNYQDLVVRVTIVDGLLPDWAPGEPETQPLVRNELLKDVFIDVFHVGPDKKLPAAPAFRLESALETPTASLSTAALRDLRRATDDYDYDKEVAAAVQSVRGAIGRTPMGYGMARVAADLVLITVESVGEAVLSEGYDLGFRVENGDTRQGSQFWVEKLERIDGPIAKLSAADLMTEEAKGILRAFRRSEKPMQVFNLYGLWYEPRIRDVVRALSRRLKIYESPSSTADQKRDAKESARRIAENCRATLTQLGFWTKILSDPRWHKGIQRPVGYLGDPTSSNYTGPTESYPERYDRALERAQRLYREAESHARATPMDKVRALAGFLDATKARKLFQDGPQLAADEQYLRSKAAASAGQMLPFAEAIRGDELFDVPALRDRNDLFLTTATSMREMLRDGSDFRKTIRLLRPSGTLIRYRRRLDEVFNRFNLPEFNGELNQEIGELMQQVEGADFPSPPQPADATVSDEQIPTDGDASDEPPPE